MKNMLFKFDNNTPIYLQLVEQLKTYIISGKMKPGERLPSVRELASYTKVNPNTMQKALVELEEMKLVYAESTSGRFVTEDEKLINKYREELMIELTKNYFLSMNNLGIDKIDVIKYINNIGDDN